MPGRKGEEGLLLLGREKVPHGFGLTGDCGSHGERAPHGFGGEEGGPCGFGVLLFATQLREQERLCQEEKR